MEKLLFEENTTVNGSAKAISSLTLAALGVGIIAASQAKVSSFRNGTSTTIGNKTIFTLGKSPLFPENVQIGMIIFGITLAAMGIFMLIVSIKGKKNANIYCRLYETYMEWSQFDGISQVERSAEYRNIADVQKQNVMGSKTLSIKLSGNTLSNTLQINKVDDAYQIIQNQRRLVK